jgi:hypothetical protein
MVGGSSEEGRRAERRDREGTPAAPGRRVADGLAEALQAMDRSDGVGLWGEALTPDDRQRLVEVARRRGRVGPLDEATAADLVEAVLPASLAAMAVGATGRRQLCERIARSLLDDPGCRSRLETLLRAARDAGGSEPGARPS